MSGDPGVFAGAGCCHSLADSISIPPGSNNRGFPPDRGKTLIIYRLLDPGKAGRPVCFISGRIDLRNNSRVVLYFLLFVTCLINSDANFQRVRLESNPGISLSETVR